MYIRILITILGKCQEEFSTFSLGPEDSGGTTTNRKGQQLGNDQGIRGGITRMEYFNFT
jgi:hypothetical protein